MTEHIEPPAESVDGGSLFCEGGDTPDFLMRETIVQRAYRQAVMYQEILDEFQGTHKELYARGDELVAKLNESCDHIGEEIIVYGKVTRTGLDYRNAKSGKAGVRHDREHDAVALPARSMGYVALKTVDRETNTAKVEISHRAETKPIKVMGSQHYGNVYQDFVIHMSPKYAGNAELVDEVFPPNEAWLRDDEYGLGETFMAELDQALADGENLDGRLRSLSKIKFGENPRLTSRAYTSLKAELAYYLTEKLDIHKGAPHFISGVSNVYFVRDDVAYDVAMAKGRHLNLIKGFSFVPNSTTPALESVTIGSDGIDYDFYYPLTGKMRVTNITSPGYEQG